MKHLATLLAVLGMSATSRHADDRVRERALRAAPSFEQPRFLPAAPRNPGSTKSCTPLYVSTARECARRVRQRERNAAKAASAAT